MMLSCAVSASTTFATTIYISRWSFKIDTPFDGWLSGDVGEQIFQESLLLIQCTARTRDLGQPNRFVVLGINLLDVPVSGSQLFSGGTVFKMVIIK